VKYAKFAFIKDGEKMEYWRIMPYKVLEESYAKFSNEKKKLIDEIAKEFEKEIKKEIKEKRDEGEDGKKYER